MSLVSSPTRGFARTLSPQPLPRDQCLIRASSPRPFLTSIRDRFLLPNILWYLTSSRWESRVRLHILWVGGGVNTLELKVCSDLAQDAHLDVIRPSRPLTIRDPTLSAHAPGGATIILGDGPTTSIDHTFVGFNSHCSDVPYSDYGDEGRRPSLYHSAEDTPLGFRV